MFFEFRATLASRLGDGRSWSSRRPSTCACREGENENQKNGPQHCEYRPTSGLPNVHAVQRRGSERKRGPRPSATAGSAAAGGAIDRTRVTTNPCSRLTVSWTAAIGSPQSPICSTRVSALDPSGRELPYEQTIASPRRYYLFKEPFDVLTAARVRNVDELCTDKVKSSRWIPEQSIADEYPSRHCGRRLRASSASPSEMSSPYGSSRCPASPAHATTLSMSSPLAHPMSRKEPLFVTGATTARRAATASRASRGYRKARCPHRKPV